MRIGWIVHGSLAQPTGGYVYDRLVVEGLRSAGDEVDVISIEPGATLGSFDHDVVVGDALAVREIAPAFEQSNVPKCLLVHHLTSWEPGHDALRAVEARAIVASDVVVTTSAATAARLRAEHPGSNPQVVTPGADRLPSRSRAPRDGAVNLLSVGSLIPRKRIDWVLGAVSRIDSPELSLRVVGDETRDPLHARSLRALNAPRTTFLGVLSDSELADELARADVLVLASSLEGYGMVLSEACFAGVPAIVARSAALPEVIGAADDAIIFDDAADLERRLRELARDPGLRAALERAAAARASTLPRWSRTVHAFAALLGAVSGR